MNRERYRHTQLSALLLGFSRLPTHTAQVYTFWVFDDVPEV